MKVVFSFLCLFSSTLADSKFRRGLGMMDHHDGDHHGGEGSNQMDYSGGYMMGTNSQMMGSNYSSNSGYMGGHMNQDYSYGAYGGHMGYYEQNFTTLECESSWACDLPYGHQGTYVCRNLTNPMSNEKFSRSMCIPNDRAWETDTCGCCDDLCPEPVQFIDSPCFNSTDDNVAQTRSAGHDHMDMVMVCRNLVNPFTGADVFTSLRIPGNRGLVEDICGCCDGVCPAPGDDKFSRPDYENVALQCDQSVSCQLKYGHNSSFVCRTIYHPVTGQPQQWTFCVPDNHGWITDTCGCCTPGCPSTPDGGFQNEDTQIMTLALEDPNAIGITASYGTSKMVFSSALVGGAALLIAMQILS